MPVIRYCIQLYPAAEYTERISDADAIFFKKIRLLKLSRIHTLVMNRKLSSVTMGCVYISSCPSSLTSIPGANSLPQAISLLKYIQHYNIISSMRGCNVASAATAVSNPIFQPPITFPLYSDIDVKVTADVSLSCLTSNPVCTVSLLISNVKPTSAVRMKFISSSPQ